MATVENLRYMFEMGYYNFELNTELLRRNKNDVVLALDSLCNGFVTESMFVPK